MPPDVSRSASISRCGHVPTGRRGRTRRREATGLDGTGLLCPADLLAAGRPAGIHSIGFRQKDLSKYFLLRGPLRELIPFCRNDIKCHFDWSWTTSPLYAMGNVPALEELFEITSNYRKRQQHHEAPKFNNNNKRETCRGSVFKDRSPVPVTLLSYYAGDSGQRRPHVTLTLCGDNRYFNF